MVSTPEIAKEVEPSTRRQETMVAAYAVNADSFVADKPQMWSEKQLGTASGGLNNVGLAPDGKRIAATMPVETSEAQKAQNHVIFLNELLRRTAKQDAIRQITAIALNPANLQ